MEMPCVCDCGRVFDLHDGVNDPTSNKVLCWKCGERKQKIYELEQKIISAENSLELGFVGKREGNKRLKELRAKLKEAENQ
jgi:hypothetical protein